MASTLVRRLRRLSPAQTRLVAVALAYLVMVAAPTVAYDLPRPTIVWFNGTKLRLLGHPTVGRLLAERHITLRTGRLLDIGGNVMREADSVPILEVDGRPATTSRRLVSGDRVRLVNGADRTEPSTIEVVREGGGNPQFLLGPGAIEVRRGLLSHEVVPLDAKPRPGPKAVALTFDDGPSPDWTPRLLAELDRLGVKATFFVVGVMAQRYPDLVKRELAQGMVVADHTWSHARLARRPDPFVRDQLERTRNYLRSLGCTVTLFRPPYGSYTPRTVTLASSLGLRTVVWSVDPADYRRPAPEVIVRRVLAQVRPGAIILMHDGGGDRSRTVSAVPLIVDALRRQGYSFETLE